MGRQSGGVRGGYKRQIEGVIKNLERQYTDAKARYDWQVRMTTHSGIDAKMARKLVNRQWQRGGMKIPSAIASEITEYKDRLKKL